MKTKERGDKLTRRASLTRGGEVIQQIIRINAKVQLRLTRCVLIAYRKELEVHCPLLNTVVNKSVARRNEGGDDVVGMCPRPPRHHSRDINDTFNCPGPGQACLLIKRTPVSKHGTFFSAFSRSGDNQFMARFELIKCFLN